jgi:hypothetical protein
MVGASQTNTLGDELEVSHSTSWTRLHFAEQTTKWLLGPKVVAGVRHAGTLREASLRKARPRKRNVGGANRRSMPRPRGAWR